MTVTVQVVSELMDRGVSPQEMETTGVLAGVPGYPEGYRAWGLAGTTHRNENPINIVMVGIKIRMIPAKPPEPLRTLLTLRASAQQRYIRIPGVGSVKSLGHGSFDGVQRGSPSPCKKDFTGSFLEQSRTRIAGKVISPLWEARLTG